MNHLPVKKVRTAVLIPARALFVLANVLSAKRQSKEASSGCWLVRLCALVILSGVAPCNGGVIWKEKTKTVQVSSSVATVEVDFAFRNENSTPIVVAEIRPGCDCLVASCSKSAFAPGESGYIRAVMEIGGGVGRMERKMRVRTIGSAEETTELTLVVNIPQEVVVEPRVLFWRVGGSPDKKVINVTIEDPKNTRIESVIPDGTAFSALVEETVENGHSHVVVAPNDTAVASQSSIRLNIDKDGVRRVIVLYAMVK